MSKVNSLESRPVDKDEDSNIDMTVFRNYRAMNIGKLSCQQATPTFPYNVLSRMNGVNRKVEPTREEIVEAEAHPGEWVYRIDGFFRDDETVPPERIIGAWKVDPDGKIIGDFIENPKYRSEKS